MLHQLLERSKRLRLQQDHDRVLNLLRPVQKRVGSLSGRRMSTSSSSRAKTSSPWTSKARAIPTASSGTDRSSLQRVQYGLNLLRIDMKKVLSKPNEERGFDWTLKVPCKLELQHKISKIVLVFCNVSNKPFPNQYRIYCPNPVWYTLTLPCRGSSHPKY